MEKVDPFSAYLPMDRRQALADGRTLPESAEGAVLFADIAGFTSLTATLVRELGAKRGAEELNRQLNVIYARLIGQVHAYQGSVIHFSGDSITCWFDDVPAGRHSGALDGARRAAGCAFAMQEVMRDFRTMRTPADSVVSMALKVAVTGGRARRFLVGDPDIQAIEVLAGHLLGVATRRA